MAHLGNVSPPDTYFSYLEWSGVRPQSLLSLLLSEMLESPDASANLERAVPDTDIPPQIRGMKISNTWVHAGLSIPYHVRACLVENFVCEMKHNTCLVF